MYGFFIGDIIGNSYTHENESYNLKTKDFKLFTNRSKYSDDTILTFATIDWLLHTTLSKKDMLETIKKFYSLYPDLTPTIYGESFAHWVESNPTTFRQSLSNGGAMRCSPIAYTYTDLDKIDSLINRAITPTHDSDHARLSAKMVCYSIIYLKEHKSIEKLVSYISETFGVNLKQNFDDFKASFTYTSDALDTVIAALMSVVNSNSFEDAIRCAVSLGGDTDTITSIAGAIAEGIFDIPKPLLDKALSYLPKHFVSLLQEFHEYMEENAEY